MEEAVGFMKLFGDYATPGHKALFIGSYFYCH